MLVSSFALLLLADVSTEASYELSWKPWLRLKKVLTLDNGWSAQSKTCLNAEWTWKRKSGTHTLQQWGSFCFCSAERCLGAWALPANSPSTPVIWNYSKRENQEACLRMLKNYSPTTCPFHICAEGSYSAQAIFETRASLQAMVLFLVVFFFFFFGVKDWVISDSQSKFTPVGSRAGKVQEL